MVGHEAFGVDLEALGRAEKGVRDAVSELGELNTQHHAEQGIGLKDLDTSVVGHEGLQAALDEFTEAWNWGVRYLVDDGVDAAEALRDTRAWYQKIDDQAADLLARGLHSVLGNPMEDVSAWDDKSAGEVVGEIAPDWSWQTQQESMGRTKDRFEGVTGWDVDGDGASGGGS